MLDIEVAVEPTQTGLDIISVADLKKRLRISHNKLDDVIEDCIVEAADKLHGLRSEIRRTIFPTTWRRYLSRWPDFKDARGAVVASGRGIIPLPLPPLISVTGITTGSGGSAETVDPALYVVRTGTIVGEIELKSGASWPLVTAGPRQIAIEFQAGYTTYPPILKRFVAIMAAHNFYNNSATVMEPRQIQINRRVEFAVSDLRKALGVPFDYQDWGE